MNVDITLALGAGSNLNGFTLSKALYSAPWSDLAVPASRNPQAGTGWAQGLAERVHTLQAALFGVSEGTEGSMMSYFSGYGIQERQPKIALSTTRDLRCPVLRSGLLEGEPEAACSAHELFDWLGAVFGHTNLCVRGDSQVLAGWGWLLISNGFSTLKVMEWWI